MSGFVAYNAWDGARSRQFKRNLKVFGPVFLGVGKPDVAKSMNFGDKIVLYSGLLRELADKLDEFAHSGQPLILEAKNEVTGKKTHVGVLEFSGEEFNVAYLPTWVMHNLGAKDGDSIMFQLRQVPKLKFLRLRPSDAAFVLSVPEPKLALEDALRSFTAVTVGDELVIHHHGVPYTFLVLEVKPETGNKAACLVGADCELEFASPDDDDGRVGTGGGSSVAASSSLTGGYAGEAAGLPIPHTAPPHCSHGASSASVGPSPSPRNGSSPSGNVQSGPRKIEVGETLPGELREGHAADFFTVVMREAYVGTHALQLVLRSQAHGFNPALGPSAGIFGSKAGAFLRPLPVHASHAPSAGNSASSFGGMLSDLPGAGGAGVGLVHSRPPTAPIRSPQGVGQGVPFFGGGSRLGGDPTPSGNPNPMPSTGASAVDRAGPLSLEADLFVSATGAVTKPTRRMFTWADVSAACDKALTLLPSNAGPGMPSGPDKGRNGSDAPLPEPNDTTHSVTLYVAVEASDADPLSLLGAHVSYTLTVNAVPLDTGPSASSVPSAGTGAAARVAPGAAADGGMQDCPAPDKTLCENCGQAVPHASLVAHSAFCKRNNTKCTSCSAVLNVKTADRHIHCSVPGWPACKAVLCSAWEREKHEAVMHGSFPCEACGQRVERETYQLHRSEDCPLRTVPCLYCGMSLQMRSRGEHEEKCGSRTAPCEVCGRLVPRKRMGMHIASGCASGGTGGTPGTPFLRYSGAEALPDFQLDGFMGANALGLDAAGLWGVGMVEGRRIDFTNARTAVAGAGRMGGVAVPPPPVPVAHLGAFRDDASYSSEGFGGEEERYVYEDDEVEVEEEGEGGGQAQGVEDSDSDFAEDRRGGGGGNAAGERKRRHLASGAPEGSAAWSGSATAPGPAEKRRATAGAVHQESRAMPGTAAPSSARERCPVCPALVASFDELQVHLLTSCAARLRGADPRQVGHLRRAIAAMVGPEMAEDLDTQISAEQNSAAASGSSGAAPTLSAPMVDNVGVTQHLESAFGATPPSSSRRARRSRLCPSCGLVFAPGEGEDEVHLHMLTGGCARRGSGEGASQDPIPFAPEGAQPGTYSLPASGSGGFAATGRGGGSAGIMESFPALFPLGLPSANLGTGTVEHGPGLGLGMGTAAAYLPAYGAYGAPHAYRDEEDEEAMLERALAASLHTSSGLSPPAPSSNATGHSSPGISPPANGQNTNSSSLGILRPPRSSSFHVLADEGEEDEHGHGGAVPVPVPARAPFSFTCPSCGHCAQGEEALHVHMLTGCAHAEANIAILFGAS